MTITFKNYQGRFPKFIKITIHEGQYLVNFGLKWVFGGSREEILFKLNEAFKGFSGGQQLKNTVIDYIKKRN